jgi:hypothetical protein
MAAPGTWQAGVREATGISAALGVWAPAAEPQAGPSRDASANPALAELPAVNAAMLEARFRDGAQAAAGVQPEQASQPASQLQDREAAGAAQAAAGVQPKQAARPASQLQDREAKAGAAEPAAEEAAQEEAGSSGRQQTECLICYNAMEFAMVRWANILP